MTEAAADEARLAAIANVALWLDAPSNARVLAGRLAEHPREVVRSAGGPMVAWVDEYVPANPNGPVPGGICYLERPKGQDRRRRPGRRKANP